MGRGAGTRIWLFETEGELAKWGGGAPCARKCLLGTYVFKGEMR